jgi:hypothetical protein
VIRNWWGEAPEKTSSFLQGGPHIPIDVVGYSDKRADLSDIAFRPAISN